MPCQIAEKIDGALEHADKDGVLALIIFGELLRESFNSVLELCLIKEHIFDVVLETCLVNHCSIPFEI